MAAMPVLVKVTGAAAGEASGTPGVRTGADGT